MAKGVRAGSRSRGPVCTPLEMNVPVNYKIVGTRKWLQEAWEPGSWQDHEVILVSDSGDLAPVKRHLNQMPVHGVDCETTGKTIKGDKGYSMNPVNGDNRIALLQIGNEDMVYVFDPDLITEFKDWLESSEFLHVLHNAIYDHKWLLVKKGIHMQRVYCSMLSEQLLTAGLLARKVGLADAVRRHEPYWLISKAVREGFITLDDEKRRMTRDMGYYSARDITLMFPLMRDQIKMLKQFQLMTVAQDEFDCIYPTAEMEIGGVELSLPIMRQIIEYWEQYEIYLADQIFKVFAEEKRAQGDVAESLIPELGFIFKLNNAGKIAALREIDIDLDNIQRDSLKEIVKNEKDFTPGQRKLCKYLAEFSNVQKMKTTYGRNMVEKINPWTNMWHPKFKQLGSGEEEGRKSGGDDKATIATGRFSSDAQQFPKPKEIFAAVTRPDEIAHVMAVYGGQIAQLKAARVAEQLQEAA